MWKAKASEIRRAVASASSEAFPVIAQGRGRQEEKRTGAGVGGAGRDGGRNGPRIGASRWGCCRSRMAVFGVSYLAASFALLRPAAGQHAQPQVRVVLAALMFLPVSARFFRL